MTSSQKASAEDKRPLHRSSLARSLTQMLVAFTFIPIVLIAGAAYWRSRTLFGDQVSAQMQNQLTNQLNQLDLAIKTKQFYLNNFVSQLNFDSELDAAITEDPQSTNFSIIRDNLSDQMRTLTPGVGNITFNQFFLMLPDGTIQMASQQGWEGVSLANSQYYQMLANSNDQTFAVYNFPPLYNNQLVLITTAQYRNEGGSHQGVLVGITEQQSLQDVLQNLVSLAPSSNAYFVTPDGKLIATDPHTMKLTAVKPSSSQNTQLTATFKVMMNGGKNKPAPLQFDNSNNSPVLAQAAWSPSMSAGLVWEIQQSVVFAQINSLGSFILLAIVIASLAMALVTWAGTRRVFRPLQSLTAITSKFAAGDFSARAEVNSQNEIGILADSFNHMAEELTELYRSLEQKVEERSRQIRTAAEVAQRATSSANLDELLDRTAELIVQQFGFYHAAIYLMDRSEKYAVLRAACSPAADAMRETEHQLDVGSNSIIGWVSANNQPRIASDITEDPIHMENKLLPETRSEAGIPISVGSLVLGALDVQSTEANAFGPDAIVMLQTLASQIAVAIRNVSLTESVQVNIHELERLYRGSSQIIAAQSENELVQAVDHIMQDSPYAAAMLLWHGPKLEIAALNSLEVKASMQNAVNNLGSNLSGQLELFTRSKNFKDLAKLESPLPLDEVQKFLSGNPVIIDENSTALPSSLMRFANQLNHQSTAILPIKQGNKLAGLIILGAHAQSLTSAIVQPYVGMTDLIGAALEKIANMDEKRNAYVSSNR